MKDNDKTQKQLTKELIKLRHRIAELEASVRQRNRFEETLRIERDKAQQYLDIAEVILVALNKKGEITLINRKGNHILGYKEGELLGKNWFTTCVPPLLRKDVKGVFRKLMAGEGKTTEFYENPALTKSGTERMLAWHNTLLKDEQGKNIGALSSGMDITERKRAEEALQSAYDKLKESETRYRILLDNIDIGINHIDVDHTILMASAAEGKQFNKPLSDFIGKKCFREFEKRDAVCPHCPGDRAMATGQSAEAETEGVRDDGSRYNVRVRAFPVFGNDGTVTGFIEIAENITERKGAEKELQESEERFRLAFENANTGVCLVDLEGNLTRVNTKMCEIFGYAREELERMTVNDIAHPEDIDKSPEFIQNTLQRKIDRATFEKRYFHKKGHVVTCEVSSTLVRNAEGAPLYFISHVHDITERKQAEARAEHLNFVLLAIRGVNQLITREKDRDRLIQGACDKLIETRGYDNVWIALIDESGRLAATAEAGLGEGFLPLVEQLERSELPYCMRMALTQAGALIIEDPFATCADCSLSNRYGDRRAMATRLEHDGKIYGMMTVSISGNYVADEEEQSLFGEVAEDIAFALYNIELEERRRQAVAALRESEERFRTVVETMKVGLGTIDEKGVLTYVNKYFSTMLGYTIDEMIGHSTLDFYYDKESRKTQEEIFAKRRAGMRDPTPYEVTWRKKDGQKVYAILSPTPIFDADGRYTGSFAIHTDITERKQAEEKLQESESRYRTLFESASDAIFILDQATGRFIDVNQAACERLGYSREELVQMTPHDIDSPEYALLVRERIETLRQCGHLFFETVHVRHDGTTIPTETSSRIITYAGKPAVISIARDITERKQAEEELHRSYQQMREMLVTTVNALAATVEMKDQYTAGHQPRATQLACAIAEKMGFSEDQIEGIRMAGSLHDIGKIVVPAEILNKPGPLAEVQYEMVKMHPQAGYDIVKVIKFPWPVAQIVLQHHELMDGSGYPQGLSGEQIMVEARILAVANVVEAMTSHRPYRAAHSIETALEEISRNKGKLYDPVAVDACLKLFTEKRFTFN